MSLSTSVSAGSHLFGKSLRVPATSTRKHATNVRFTTRATSQHDQRPNPNHGHLKLFVDTADTKEWQRWLPTGLIYGVTTNPLLLERAGVECTLPALKDLASEAFHLGASEVQLQTWGGSASELVSTGLHLAELDPRIVVKIPITLLGLAAASSLKAEGISVTLTGLYSAKQALMAMAAGADYAAPYLGRIEALGTDGLEEIAAMQEMIDASSSTLKLLVASIKTSDQVIQLAAVGVPTFALPPSVLDDLVTDGNTEAAAQDFERAARATVKAMV